MMRALLALYLLAVPVAAVHAWHLVAASEAALPGSTYGWCPSWVVPAVASVVAGIGAPVYLLTVAAYQAWGWA